MTYQYLSKPVVESANKTAISQSSAVFQDNRPSQLQRLALVQGMHFSPIQREGFEDGELSQAKVSTPVQRERNNTGLPDHLKSGMERVSGLSLDHVKVHYNSTKPSAVQAHAYAQGSDIHVAPGQEKHLPHELGHVVQQAQGRVQATTNVGGMPVNDNPALESEASKLGEAAVQRAAVKPVQLGSVKSKKNIVGQRLCSECLKEEEEHGTPVQRQAIQRIDEQQSIVGSTHLVRMVEGSIMDGEEGPFLEHGTKLTIIPNTKILSRRGPNQEEFSELDRDRGTPIYTWYQVQAPNQFKGFYVRADTLSETAPQFEAEAKTAEPDGLTEIDQAIADNKSKPGHKFLKAESILHVTSGVLKCAAAIGLGILGAFNAMFGQLAGGVSAIAIGVMKWIRAKAVIAVGVTMDAIVQHAQNLRNYVIRGQRNGTIASFAAGKEKLADLEAQKAKGEEKVNQIRTFESGLGVLVSVGNCITGAFVACLGIIPNLLKASRAFGQLKGTLTDKKKIAMLIKLEAIVSALLAIFSIEESIRALGGGKPLVGDFGKKLLKDDTTDTITDTFTDLKAGVGGLAPGGIGLGIAGVKAVRGANTEGNMDKKAMKKLKKEGHQEQLKNGRRLRKDAGQVQGNVNE